MSFFDTIKNTPEITVTEEIQEGSYPLRQTKANLRLYVKAPAGLFKAGDLIPVARLVSERVGEGRRRSRSRHVGYTIEHHPTTGGGAEYFDRKIQRFVQNYYFDHPQECRTLMYAT